MTPMAIGHGTDDAIVPFRKSLWMAAALEQAHVDHLMIEVPHGRHMYNDWPNINETLDETIDFVLKYMRPPESEDFGSQPELQDNVYAESEDSASQTEVQYSGSQPEAHDSVNAESEDTDSQPRRHGRRHRRHGRRHARHEVQNTGSQ